MPKERKTTLNGKKPDDLQDEELWPGQRCPDGTAQHAVHGRHWTGSEPPRQYCLKH